MEPMTIARNEKTDLYVRRSRLYHPYYLSKSLKKYRKIRIEMLVNIKLNP